MNTNEKIKIAVLGASGQLGQTFMQIAEQYNTILCTFYTKEQLDILDRNALINTFQNSDYQYIINCAAYTQVDKAESEPELCMAVNATACGYITEAIKDTGIRLVHFSTDYLYHQYYGFPLKETDTPNPQGVYAISKLKGEEIIRASGVPTLILRASWIISPYGHNFVKTMLRLGSEREKIQVVNDQYGAPTYAKDLAEAVISIILQVEKQPDLIDSFNDTYNYANEGLITWYDLAYYIMQVRQLACTVEPISTDAYPTAAKRPRWSLLAKNKFKGEFNIAIPHWYTSLKSCLEELKTVTYNENYKN